MESNSRQIDLKCDQKLESIRRRLRQRLSSIERRHEKTNDLEMTTNGLFLEMFCFQSSLAREKHFCTSLTIGDIIVSRVVSRIDSNNYFVKLIESRNQVIIDLNLKANILSPVVLETDDVIKVSVTRVQRDQKTVISAKMLEKVSDFSENLWKNDSNFGKCLKSCEEFRNPFVLRKKTFSSLLFDKKPEIAAKEEPKREIREERKRKRSASTESSSSGSSSSSSTSSSTTTTSSDDSRRRHRRRQKKEKVNEKSSKKFSFVVKKSTKSVKKSLIPGFEEKSDEKADKRSHLSEKMRKQLKRDSEIEQKIRLLTKTVQKND